MSALRRIVTTVAVTFCATSVVSIASATCPATPDTTCKLSLVAGFTYVSSPDDSKDKLLFKMIKGSYSPVGDFGSPTTTDSYDLCIYAHGARIGDMSVGPDGDCADNRCWQTKPKGPLFKDKTGTPDGLTLIKLISPLDGTHTTKLKAKGKGANLDDMAIPFAEPIVVQLRNSLGNCWAAVFSGPEQVSQDPLIGKVKLKFKADVFPTCSDGIQNGTESDVDCGGACPDCGYNDSCIVDGDCAGGSCAGGACAATCSDGIVNQDESDEDCGGVCGATCDYGQECNSGADCIANLCRNDACAEHRVFVTSTLYEGGNLGGLDGADAACAARATAAGLGGSWTAWLSTSSVDAIDRIADYEYYNIFGGLVFSNKAQITSTGLPNNAIRYNELYSDTPFATPYVWTGSTNFGVEDVGGTCGEWDSTAATGTIGRANQTTPWSNFGTDACTASWRLYCFEQ